MWNGKTVTVAEIILAAKQKNAQNMLSGKDQETINTTCCICGKDISTGFRFDKILSGNFGEYNNIRNFTISRHMCPACSFSIIYIQKTYGNQLSWPCIALGYMNDNDVWFKEYLWSEAKQSKDEITDFLLSPPEGFFFAAFNKSMTRTKQHFMYNGITNYNTGNCSSYFITHYENSLLVDVDFLKKYVNIGIPLNYWSIKYYLSMNNSNGKKKQKIPPKFNGTIKAINTLGVNEVIKNIQSLDILNSVLKLSKKEVVK